MARKHKHEEHLNAEAWAIPYGDLVTLLLALFVVMYAMSSVNEGKYRVLSESLNEAFHGTPRTMKPIQVGEKSERGMGAASAVAMPPRPRREQVGTGIPNARPQPVQIAVPVADAAGREALKRIADEVEQALGDLIRADLVMVRRKANHLEIEIRTDILFASGVAAVAVDARPVLAKLGSILKPFPNPLRVEGHTDNLPIATSSFPSNWELSAARAASVIHVLIDAGLLPQRLSVAGYGEFRPAAENASAEGRNRNRRVVLVVLADEPLEGLNTADAGPAVVAAHAQAPATLSAAAP